MYQGDIMTRKKVLKEKLVLKKSVRNFINQIFISTIILLIGLIVIKRDPALKVNIKKDVYENSAEFMKFKKIYDDYFGNIIPLNNMLDKEKIVFDEKLAYISDEKYKDGVKLTVEDNYLVPTLQEGIVVYIGEKENYGNTVIVEQTDGVDVFYSNLKEINVKLYDYLGQGELIGEVNNNYLYLIFQKEGNVIDYKKYI